MNSSLRLGDDFNKLPLHFKHFLVYPATILLQDYSFKAFPPQSLPSISALLRWESCFQTLKVPWDLVVWACCHGTTGLLLARDFYTFSSSTRAERSFLRIAQAKQVCPHTPQRLLLWPECKLLHLHHSYEHCSCPAARITLGAFFCFSALLPVT